MVGVIDLRKGSVIVIFDVLSVVWCEMGFCIIDF